MNVWPQILVACMEVVAKLAAFVLLLLLTTCHVAYADTDDLEDPEVWYESDDDPSSGGWIVYNNQLTYNKETVEILVVQTPLGDITFRIDRLPEVCDTKPNCPDTIEAWDIPPGVTVTPPAITVDERMTERLRVMPYLGF